MPTDDERHKVARRLLAVAKKLGPNMDAHEFAHYTADVLDVDENMTWYEMELRLADLIEPSYKPSVEYEAWYNSLSHFGDERGGPSTIRELIEEIVWSALTVDLGPNGNTDPSTGIDEGRVYTDKLFAEWEREALRLSGGIDRDALLALADEMEAWALTCDHYDRRVAPIEVSRYARRIREALGVNEDE